MAQFSGVRFFILAIQSPCLSILCSRDHTLKIDATTLKIISCGFWSTITAINFHCTAIISLFYIQINEMSLIVLVSVNLVFVRDTFSCLTSSTCPTCNLAVKWATHKQHICLFIHVKNVYYCLLLFCSLHGSKVESKATSFKMITQEK